MVHHDIKQSAINRALADTKTAHRNPLFFWLVEVCMMGVFGYLADAGYLIPHWHTSIWVAIGAGVGYLIILGVNLIRAPYRQRNEARKRVAELEFDKKDRQNRARLRKDIGVLIIEGADILRAFKSIRTFDEPWPEDELKAWIGKVSSFLQSSGLNDYYPLWFKDVAIDFGGASLTDYVELCERALNRLVQICETLRD